MLVKCKKFATNFLSQIQGGFDMDTKLVTIQIRTKQWAFVKLYQEFYGILEWSRKLTPKMKKL